MHAIATNGSTATTRDVAGRLDAMGWGSLFLLTGFVMLVPGIPNGAWLVGVGAILVAVNLVRLAYGLTPDWLWVIVGGGAMLAGVGAIAGLDLPVVALVLVACGLVIIGGSLVRHEAR